MSPFLQKYLWSTVFGHQGGAFDALPPEDDPAWERRAVAETYAALGREAQE